MLAQDRIRINKAVCRIAAHEVHPGDTIEIGARRNLPQLPPGLEILFEDSAILIVHKPTGLLTVATPDEREHNAFAILRQYMKALNPRQTVYVVHRLDKYASGILVFARTEEVLFRLKELFSSHDIKRKYWAIVEGKVEQERGTIRSHLTEGKSFRVHSTKDNTQGKIAVTHYRVLRRFPNITTLEVALETGRKNQIRVHLSELGHPVVGDRTYGTEKDPLGRLGLHAFHLGFVHPIRGVPVEFTSEPPPEFLPYLPKDYMGRDDIKTKRTDAETQRSREE